MLIPSLVSHFIYIVGAGGHTRRRGEAGSPKNAERFSVCPASARLRASRRAMPRPTWPHDICRACRGPHTSPLHQSGDVGGGRIREPVEVIAAFEHRYDTAVGALVGDLHEALRRPREIRLEQIEIGERVAHMRVEAG